MFHPPHPPWPPDVGPPPMEAALSGLGRVVVSVRRLEHLPRILQPATGRGGSQPAACRAAHGRAPAGREHVRAGVDLDGEVGPVLDLEGAADRNRHGFRVQPRALGLLRSRVVPARRGAARRGGGGSASSPTAAPARSVHSRCCCPQLLPPAAAPSCCSQCTHSGRISRSIVFHSSAP